MPTAVKTLADHAANIMQAATLATVLWVGHSIQDLNTTVAVHEFRIGVLEVQNDAREADSD